MTLTLPPLPYALDALEPVISAEALELHHAGHHGAYVEKLNAALKDQTWPGRDEPGNESVEQLVARLDSLPQGVQGAVRKFGGSLKTLRSALDKQAANLFGSGWVFLAWNPHSEALELRALPNQDSPLTQGLRPLLTLDLWEHAHYLDYRNKRDDWVRDWWNLVDWRQVEKRLDRPV